MADLKISELEELTTPDPLEDYLAIVDSSESKTKRIKPSSLGTGGFAVGTFSVTGTGNLSVTSLNFTPKMVEFTVFYPDVTSAGENAPHSMGVTDGTNQWATSGSTRSGTGATLLSITDGCILLVAVAPGPSQTIRVRGSFVSFNANGFTVNFSTVSSTHTVAWKAYA